MVHNADRAPRPEPTANRLGPAVPLIRKEMVMTHALVGSVLCLAMIGVATGGQQAQQRTPTAQGQSAPDTKACQEAMARHDQM